MTTATQSSTPSAPVSHETEFVTRAAWRAGVLGAVNALFVILAVRAILLVAVVGAFYLTVIAINAPDPWRVGTLAVYAILVVLPTAWLASRR